MSRTYRRGWKPTQTWAKKHANRKFRRILKRFDKENGNVFPSGSAYKTITFAAYDICDYGGGWSYSPDAQWTGTNENKFRGCVYADGKFNMGKEKRYRWTQTKYYYDSFENKEEISYLYDVYDYIAKPFFPKDHKREAKMAKKIKKIFEEKELDDLIKNV